MQLLVLHRLRRILLLALGMASPLPTAAAQREGRAAPILSWPTLTRDARPWTRWWWMGSAVDGRTLTAELEALDSAGFGGVEVTAIYGARGAEASYVPYLSRRWVELLSHTIREAHRLGMGVDIPPGSGWRLGGPFVDSADANASLQVTTDSVRGGATWEADLTPRHVNAVTAFSDGGEVVDIARGQPASPVRWQAPNGRPWTVYVAGTRWSGDKVKRPAPGGEGLAIDVFSRAAVERFLRSFGERIATLPTGAIGAYFHDSFEYSGDATPVLFDEFRRRRGYDLARELPALLGRGDADHVARVKSDYRQTIDELLLENFLIPLASWSHAHGSLLREQAHGSPGNLLDLYAASDVPETEIFGPLAGTDADPLVNKFASSAAHVAHRRFASAEAFTWLGEHFSGTLDDVKQAADRLFLAGINHLVYHGTAYSPPSAMWPGWQFYASMEFNPRNAFWHDLPALNRYVARVQSLLQSARPDNDVLLYWPVWDNWHDPAGRRMDFTVQNPTWLRDKPLGEVAATLWKRGFGFDYVSDRQLMESRLGARGQAPGFTSDYRAIVVPRAAHMPPATFERLIELARGGATVLFVDSLPLDVPGFASLDQRRARLRAAEERLPLGAPVASGIRTAMLGRGRVLVGPDVESLLVAADVQRETIVDNRGIGILRQRWSSGHQYFVSNTGTDTLDGWVSLSTPAAVIAIMDPMTGRAGVARTRRAADSAIDVYLQLQPGQSLVLRTTTRPTPEPTIAWAYRRAAGTPVILAGPWSVRFVAGGPVLPPAFQSDSLVPWTGRGDAEADRFAGTARYTVHFDAPDHRGENWLLDLGRVAESARVRLNGKDLGVLIARPFSLETGPLKSRGNVLEIEVTNLSANRIRDLDRRGVRWKIFHDINYVNLDYKPFDASAWPVRTSGLVGPVTLTPLAIKGRSE